MTSEPTVPGEDETVRAHDRDPSTTSLGGLRKGDRIGRFRVERTLGRGGMGLVVAATDDDLDRTVAIKIVRPTGEGSTSPRSRMRLLREARSMAKISHPNVITVHEVGTVGDDVFVAMEYIDGGTLDDWIAEGERSWSAIVQAWIAAGRGLAAAHSAGLVHRDFKPANVLVSRDGRILVTDFGIAGLVGQLEPATATDRADAVGSMTRTGALMGTPRYMAPEQHRGASVDARADQFAFCVSLWEAVYGEHPFGSSSAASLVAAVIDGQPRRAPQSTAPAGLARILARGLEREPADRYDAIDELIRSLERLLDARRRRRWTIGATLALGTVLTVGFVSGRGIDPESACTDAVGDWEGIWDDRIRKRVQAAFETSDDHAIRIAWGPFVAAIDDIVARTDAASLTVCKDAQRPGADPVEANVRRHCLRRSRSAIGALTSLLADRDQAILARALDSAAALPDPKTCTSLEATSTSLEVPDAIGGQVDAIDARVAEAAALSSAGETERSLAILESLAETVDELGHVPTQAWFRIVLGSMYFDADAERARVELRRAYVLATATGAVTLAAEAARLLSTVGTTPEMTQFWLEVSTALVERWGLTEPFELTVARGLMAREEKDVEAAEHWFREALEHATSPRQTAAAHGNLGSFYGEQGRFVDARRHLGFAVQSASEFFGPNHRRVLAWKVNVVAIDMMKGEFDRGLREAAELLEAQSAVMSPDHPELAVTHTFLAYGLRSLERFAEARVHDEEALRIRHLAYSDDNQRTIESMQALVLDLMGLDLHDPAMELSTRMLDAANRAFAGAEHLSSEFMVTRASVLGHAGHTHDAIRALEDVLALDNDAITKTTRMRAEAELGHWLLEVGRTKDARAHIERASEASGDEVDMTVRRQLTSDLERLQEAESP